jgi:type I restriction enzyme S subunit
MQEVIETRVARKAPSLRFAGFKGNWNEEKIGTGIDLVSGRHLLPDEYNNTGDGVAYFTGPSDLTNDIDHLTKWTKIIGNTGVKGDVLLTVKGSGVGTLLHLELDEAALGRQLMAIKTKRHSTGFLFQRLLLLQPYFEALASGNMIPGLSRPDILTTKVYFPTLPEQQKIAAFLGAVDRKIQQLKRKQALLEQYKKGVVQQLFAQELRFKRKDGGEYPEWEEKRLGEILTIGSGRDYKHLGKGDVPVFGTGGYMLSVNEALYDGETVFIGRKGTIDKPFYFKGKFWTVDTLFYTHQYRGVIPQFVLALFQRINWREHNEASGVPSLSKTTIEKITVELPSLEEQARIAGFLMALDAKVAGVAQAVAAAQQWKKGLLQQMFV